MNTLLHTSGENLDLNMELSKIIVVLLLATHLCVIAQSRIPRSEDKKEGLDSNSKGPQNPKGP